MKVSGTLKLDQALYRELEAFSKFGGDLDAATKNVIDKGARNVEILKQPQFAPYSVEKQVAIIYLGTNNLVREVPVNQVRAFEDQFLHELENKYRMFSENSKKSAEEGLGRWWISPRP
jgi:F-type H+-transporting ATPase subunit alpha